jgi:glucose/arabinose dehydrogenase
MMKTIRNFHFQSHHISKTATVASKTFRMSVLAGAAFLSIMSSALAVTTNIPIEDPIPALIQPTDTMVRLQPVTSGLISPVGGAVAPGDKKHIYVFDQVGQIWSINISDNHRTPQRTLFLDVSSRMVTLGLFPPLNYDERGLLGLAFHPDYKKNGLFYTYTSEPTKPNPDFSTQPAGVAPDHQSVVTEWHVNNRDEGRGKVDVNSARELMRFDKPQFNHNGGALAFGPDKLLYISVGDGGNANDVASGHVPGGNAQSLDENNVLGKILRIDPLSRNSTNGKYGIPADNPFVGKPGPDEIYAYGFRNPYRMSFDKGTGQLWVSDVGQNDLEEVDIVTKGGNYGWPIKEATFLFDNGGPPLDPAFHAFVYKDSPGLPAGLIDPIAQYDHVDGVGAPETRVAAIGGFVYRGSKIDAFKGHYIFGDYSAEIGEAANGHLFILDDNKQVKEIKVAGRAQLGLAVLGWVEDAKGEIYLLANGTGTLDTVKFGKTGAVYKLAPVTNAGGDDDDDD